MTWPAIEAKILDEIRAWQHRPLDAIYPIIWLDGLMAKVHQGKQVINKTVFVVFGVNLRSDRCVEADLSIGQRCRSGCRIGCHGVRMGDEIPRCDSSVAGNRDNIIPFFRFGPEIRQVIYTTNAIESLNMSMRKLTRNRRIFPNDEAAIKALCLAVQQASRNWKMIHHWKPAVQAFQTMFGEERVPVSAL